jgi:tetratricopeptide (TPR) repeat protein
LAAALTDEAGPALAAFVAARDALGRDHDGAAALVEALPAALAGPAVGMLRAELALQDHGVPSRVGHGRANRELEAVLRQDPQHVAAQLATSQLAQEDGRHLEALEHLQGAPRADPTPSGPVLLQLARLQLSAGLDAAAVESARQAQVALPGLCDALGLEYDVAHRRDAVAESDALLGRLEACPGYLQRAVEHLRARGRHAEALARARELLALDESQAGAAITVAGLLAAGRQYGEAVTALQHSLGLWPRSPQLLKALGDVEEQAGHGAEALRAREAALLVDGGDLALRRAVERARTGQELLAEEAISTREALADYQAGPGSEDATSAFVLDFAATRAYPDGSSVDRIHVIQKALDQQGVQEIAEVHLPGDATLLALRTLKPDGRRLEPEVIEGKESISLPGVQVGDLVEYEYLLAHPSRGPGLPGFTAGNFYFQVARQPNARSVYVVKAPRGAGLQVDAHRLSTGAPRQEGELEVFRHEERRVPPSLPEPQGPPSANEWLPFVSVGSGEEGSLGLLTSYADASLENGLVTTEVAAFARGAAGPTVGEEAVRRVHAAVMARLSGRDAGLSMSAASSVAQDRGSRTWLLVASLRALGLDARLAAVRSFAADPAPYRFPAEGLFDYLCVRVQLGVGAEARLLWLDPVVRFGPFGELPELATGGREAWLLPEPGRPAERVSTPPAAPRATKRVELTLALSEDGALTGAGNEVYTGFEAAQLGEALGTMSTEQRDQALQAALSRYFGGAELSELKVSAERQVGGTVTLAYHFSAPRYARGEGAGRLVGGALTFPHQLGRRYLATPTRKTPLFIEATEAAEVTARLTLPPGWRLKAPLGEVTLQGPSGRYLRTERQEGDAVTVTESFRLDQSRIAPSEYDAFGQFAGEVDLLQQREVFFERGDGGGPVVSTRL